MSEKIKTRMIWLFSLVFPNGSLMRLSEEEIKEKLDSGKWFDCPSKVTDGKIVTNETSSPSELELKFKQDPASLTKEEHIALGKDLGIKLTMNYNEDTMINLITAELDKV